MSVGDVDGRPAPETSAARLLPADALGPAQHRDVETVIGAAPADSGALPVNAIGAPAQVFCVYCEHPVPTDLLGALALVGSVARSVFAACPACNRRIAVKVA